MHQPGTWRRLKISLEISQGRGLPRLPREELVRLLGLLASIQAGNAAEVLDRDDAQAQAGEAAAQALGGASLEEACLRIARSVDVRPLL